MKLLGDRVRELAGTRGLTLSEVLRRARISRNAFYTLARRPTVLPRTLHSLASTLGVPCSTILEEDVPITVENRASALLQEARRIHARHPRSSFDTLWHTLWLLEVSPAERLQRSLVRGRPKPPHR